MDEGDKPLLTFANSQTPEQGAKRNQKHNVPDEIRTRARVSTVDYILWKDKLLT